MKEQVNKEGNSSPETFSGMDVDGFILPVMELFYSIQGEGFNTGTPAFFIRLGGCDVGCHWCDVKESWDAGAHLKMTVDSILSKVLESKANAVVITGGEPLMYNLKPLCDALKKKNIDIFLETSGAYPFSGSFDWICVSPKKFKMPTSEMLSRANELKVIVFNDSDFLWAEQNAKKVSPECKLFLQPEWEKSKTILPDVIDFVKAHPEWKMSLQTHKWMGIS